jgi:SAM-dependent methyltransferase
MTESSKQYWERALRPWAAYKYRPEGGDNLFERWWPRCKRLDARNDDILKVLAPHVRGKSVVDIGCGAGHIAPLLIASGATAYRGYDQVSYVEELVEETARQNGVSDRVTARTCAVADLRHEDITGDVVICIGALKHLVDSEVEHFFRIVFPKPFFLVGMFAHLGWRPLLSYMGPKLGRGHLTKLRTCSEMRRQAQKAGYETVFTHSRSLDGIRSVITTERIFS